MANPSINITAYTAACKQWRLAMLTLMLLTISACDGGLFGTGDDTGGIDITTPPTDDAPAAGGGGGGTGGSESPGDSPSPGAAGDNTGSTTAFENLIPSGLQTPVPLLKIINQTDTILTIRVNPTDTLDGTNTTPGNSSSEIPLSLMSNTVVVTDPAMQTLLTIDPLTAADSTLTTVIIRKPVSAATMNTDTNYLVASTQARSTVSNMSLLRLIQVSALDATNQAADFTLSPDTPNPGSSELSFNNVDALANAVTNYQLVDAGQYLLNDSLNRFSPINVLIESDTVYTLLLTDATPSSLLIEIDSDVTIP